MGRIAVGECCGRLFYRKVNGGGKKFFPRRISVPCAPCEYLFLTKRTIITKLGSNIVYPFINIFVPKCMMWHHIQVCETKICKAYHNLTYMCGLGTDQANDVII